MKQQVTMQKSKYVAADFYIYEVEVLALGAGVTGNGSFSVDADGSFQLDKLTYFAEVAGGAQTDSTRVVPLVNILITSTGSGRQLMNQAAPLPALFGTGEIPFILTRPKIFSPNSKVTLSLANFSAATTYNLRLAFIGQKLYTGG